MGAHRRRRSDGICRERVASGDRETDARIHEIWPSATGWQHDDLEELAFFDPNSPLEDSIAAWGDPVGFSTSASRDVYAGTVGILGGPAIGELWLSRQGI